MTYPILQQRLRLPPDAYWPLRTGRATITLTLRPGTLTITIHAPAPRYWPADVTLRTVTLAILDPDDA